MRRHSSGLVFVAAGIISTFGAFCTYSAAEQTTPVMPRQMLELKKHGTVSVTRDKAGKVESIKLIVTSYEITLDEDSKPLEEMDGKKVRVLSTYKKVNNEGWLKVNKIETLDAETKDPVATETPEKKETGKTAPTAPAAAPDAQKAPEEKPAEK